MTRNRDLRGIIRGATIALALSTAIALGCATEGGTPAAGTAASAGTPPADAMAQATAGGPLYGQFCAKCHGDGGQGTDKAPPVVGPNALPLDPPAGAKYRKTQFHTAKDVADFVLANMPPQGPKPTVDQYLDILAFDLKANGVDLTGKPPLSPDNLAGYVLHP
jgi:cytochrome c